MKRRRLWNNEDGYSLVIVAALFAAFAVAASAYLDRTVATQQITRQSNMQDQLTRLTNAIVQYATFNSGRYPCPARYDLIPTDANFGVSVSNCYTGTPSGITILSGGSDIIRGMVPVRALAPYGINASDAFDNWGSRIMYVVSRQLTPSGSGTAGTRSAVTAPTINLTLTSPDFLLVSYGRDKMGAYGRSQDASSLATGPSIGCSAASTVTREENCDNDATFIVMPPYTPTNATTSTYYDDVVSVYAPNLPAPATCGGTWVGGYCWYMAGVTISCDTYCGSHGGYNAATATYAGSSGTLTNCDYVVSTLAGYSDPADFDTLNSASCAVGCTYDSDNDVGYRCTQTTTSSGSGANYGHHNWLRICACNE